MTTTPPQTIPLLFVLFGPTSSGKTQLSIELAKRVERDLDREFVVVSADSRQVYKYMDIGTSKATPEEMLGVRHEMIDVTEPVRKFELNKYANLARRHIANCFDTGKIPLVVGGTGIYVKALLEGWEIDRTAELRRSLHKDFPPSLSRDAHQMLRRLDRAAAAKVHPNNYEVVINTLASIMGGDEPDRRAGTLGQWNVLLGLDPGQQALDARVGATYDTQVQRGLFDEICELASRYDLDREIRRSGRDSQNQVLHTHGYREYFELAVTHGKHVADLDKRDLNEVRDRVVHHIQMYTRRQRSWFRKLPGVRMIDSPIQAFRLVTTSVRRAGAPS